MGARKEETASLCWREVLTDEEAKTSNYVDLDKGIIRFHDTKNRNDHELPVCDAARKILEERKTIVIDTEKHPDKLRWVFQLVPLKQKWSLLR